MAEYRAMDLEPEGGAPSHHHLGICSRQGRLDEAMAEHKSGRAVLNWLWLALATQRLGKAEEAAAWLGKAQAWLNQYHDGIPVWAENESGLHYHNWLEATSWPEAEALIPSTGPRSGRESRDFAPPSKPPA